MDAHLPPITIPPPLPQVPACPTTPIGNELRIDMAHALVHTQAILRIRFSQDGKYLAAGCQDGNSYIYDVQTGTLIHVLRDILVEKEVINAVCFSRDGKYLATGSSSGSVNVWNLNTKSVQNTFKGHSTWVRSLDVSPSGNMLVSTSGSFVRLWNMCDGAPTKDLTDGDVDSYYTSAVFSPDGEYVAASHGDGMLRVWHAYTGQLMWRVKAHKDIAHDVKFTPDGKGLVSGGGDNTLKYWNISSWNAHGSSQASDFDRVSVKEATLSAREYSGHLHAGRCLAISPDGRWIAAGSIDALVGIWEARSGVMQYNLSHNDWVCSVDFSPAGDYIASSEYDGTVKIWKYSCTPGDIPVLS